MDDMVCIRCNKRFKTECSLSAHEVQCEASKVLTSNLLAKHYCLEKAHSKKKCKRSFSPSGSGSSSSKDETESEHAKMPVGMIDSFLAAQDEMEEIPQANFLPGNFIGLRQAMHPPLEAPSSPGLVHLGPPPHLTLYQTEPDAIGLFCVYPTLPTLIPNVDADLIAVVDAPTLEQCCHIQSSLQHLGGLTMSAGITSENLYFVFSSLTAGLLMCWQYSGSTSKLISELNWLWSYIKDPLFNSADKRIFFHDREWRHFDKYLMTESNPFVQSMVGYGVWSRYHSSRRKSSTAPKMI
ncbi:hypothetical protein J3R82DRAFT_11356 [Butyriboletus roseoflavus]|nr:hypothetical protein J3R82DRAFT_11356 [Butyriboletus roseoflavus]